MKKNNKGFTLVELIVVIVILGILAAILVPALLGYVDKAKEQQDVLNAKSALTATQAKFSELYGKSQEPKVVFAAGGTKTWDTAAYKKDVLDSIEAMAEADIDVLAVEVKGTTGHDPYTVAKLVYHKTNSSIWLKFDGSSWDSITANSEKSNIPTLTGDNAFYLKGSAPSK